MPDCFHRRHGKCEAEGGSVAQAALDGNLAAQRLNQPPHQRQSQACAALGECD